jgi:hypothetical protein
VYYHGRTGRVIACVAKVHYDSEEPYYTVMINGVERSTVRARLTRVDGNISDTGGAASPPGTLPPISPPKGMVTTPIIGASRSSCDSVGSVPAPAPQGRPMSQLPKPSAAPVLRTVSAAPSNGAHDVLAAGSNVYYHGRTGRVIACVAKVHYDSEEPYYTVLINGVERSTVRARLTRVDGNISDTRGAPSCAGTPPLLSTPKGMVQPSSCARSNAPASSGVSPSSCDSGGSVPTPALQRRPMSQLPQQAVATHILGFHPGLPVSMAQPTAFRNPALPFSRSVRPVLPRDGFVRPLTVAQAVPSLPVQAAVPKLWQEAMSHAVAARAQRIDDMLDDAASGSNQSLPLLNLAYECSASRITANSRRLRTLPKHSPAYDVAVADTAADIAFYGNVSPMSKANNMNGYKNGREVHGKIYVPGVEIHCMHVCGACGVRDPELQYKRTGDYVPPPASASHAEVEYHRLLYSSPRLEALRDLPDDHFLVIPPGPLARLRARPDIVLFGADEGEVRVPELALHNVVQLGPRAMHLIKEAVLPGECIDLCPSCASGYRRFGRRVVLPNDDVMGSSPPPVAGSDVDALPDASQLANGAVPAAVGGPPPRPALPAAASLPPVGGSPPVAAQPDVFDTTDFYASTAPEGSVASGCDFGSLSSLTEAGVAFDVSDVEQLALAETRCYQHTIKVSQTSDTRPTFSGHSIICPHEYVPCGDQPFGVQVLRAALLSLRVILVGKSGVQGRLEQKCLRLHSMKLRPTVIYNSLMLRHRLQGNPAPPSLAQVRSMVAATDVANHVRVHARRVVDPKGISIERAAVASDINEVRAGSDGRAFSNDEEGSVVANPGADSSTDTEGELVLDPVGLMQDAEQGMEAVLKGIERSCTREKEGEFPAFVLRSDGVADNDYAQASENLMKTWWPMFLLGRGPCQRGKALTKKTIRNLFLYYDNRAAKNIALLFHLASVVLRHEANLAVGATVTSNPEAFEQFKTIVNDPGFEELLRRAKADPTGEDTRELLRRVLPFLNLSSGRVMCTARERASEVTKMMGASRYNGPASNFWSVAPDDVHDKDVIRFSYPYSGPGEFPAVEPPAFIEALQGQTVASRHNAEFDLREATLQNKASNNPIACTLIFDRVMNAVMYHLLCMPHAELRKNLPLDAREPGVIGKLLHQLFVKECNKRKSQHAHGQAYGGLTPQLIADACSHPALQQMAMDALDSQLMAQLPLEFHAVAFALERLKVGKRKDPAHPIAAPLPSSDPGDEPTAAEAAAAMTAFMDHSFLVVANRNIHGTHVKRHCASCDIGKRGKTGCRFNAGWGHGFQKSRCIQLRPHRTAAEVAAHPHHDGSIPIRCPECYADGALKAGDLGAVRKTDLKYDIAYSAHAPEDLCPCPNGVFDTTATDHRPLSVELARPSPPQPMTQDVLWTSSR